MEANNSDVLGCSLSRLIGGKSLNEVYIGKERLFKQNKDSLDTEYSCA